MPNKRYNRGSAFERRVKRELEELGYYVVKSGGSRGVLDLLAIDANGNPLGIQCKKDGKITKAELVKLRNFCRSFHIEVLIVSKPKRNEPVMYEPIQHVKYLLSLPEAWQEIR